MYALVSGRCDFSPDMSQQFSQRNQMAAYDHGTDTVV